MPQPARRANFGFLDRRMPPLRPFPLAGALLVLALLAGAAGAQDIALPAPRGADHAINRILAARRDATAFAPTALSRQAVSDLLWAATGINRPVTGHRTTNYSYASRDEVIYVLCAEGVFVYDQLEHLLTRQSTTDLRPLLAAPATAAPLTFAIASYNSSIDFFGAIHSGFVSENIALACADRGLASLPSATIPAALPAALGLPAGQVLLALHSVGHPEGATAADPAWGVAAGVLPPAAVDTAPALRILKCRRSTRAFAATAFSDQTLADLLWAGLGHNGTADPERTAPPLSGPRSIDLYVARAGGVYRYVTEAGQPPRLVQVSTTEVRGTLGYASVPAIFIYVADYAKLTGPNSTKQRLACLHTGHISQNVAAYAAAEGFGELVRSSVADVSAALGLTVDQHILFTQTLGHPSAPPGASTVAVVAGAGGTVAGNTTQSVAFGAAGAPLTAIAAPGYQFSHWSGLPGGRVPTPTLALPYVTCAMNLTAVFVTAPGTYTTWRAANFSGTDRTDDAISGPDADPDGVGLSNLARYAFGLPARGPVAHPIATGTTTVGSDTFLTLTFPSRDAADGLTYTLEASPDLVTWTAVPDRTYTAGSGPITAHDDVALGATPRRFLRLRLTTP